MAENERWLGSAFADVRSEQAIYLHGGSAYREGKTDSTPKSDQKHIRNPFFFASTGSDR